MLLHTPFLLILLFLPALLKFWLRSFSHHKNTHSHQMVILHDLCEQGKSTFSSITKSFHLSSLAFHTGLAGWDANISRSLLHQMLLRTVVPWHDLSEAEYQVNAQDMRAASTVAKHQLISSRSFTCFSRCRHCKQAKIRLRPQNKPSSLERKSDRKGGCKYGKYLIYVLQVFESAYELKI